MIGQSLVDITHHASAIEITDSLKPSVTFPSSVAQPDGVFSQFRQFYVRFKSTVYNSRVTSHIVSCMCMSGFHPVTKFLEGGKRDKCGHTVVS